MPYTKDEDDVDAVVDAMIASVVMILLWWSLRL
jgi:hypothetical protein